MTAILEAGGFSEVARSNKTKLVREKNGKKETRVVKMGEIFGKGDRSLDVALEPGDVLVVPKSFF
jgi:polysaccharide export outer membrane protein